MLYMHSLYIKNFNNANIFTLNLGGSIELFLQSVSIKFFSARKKALADFISTRAFRISYMRAAGKVAEAEFIRPVA